MPPSKAQVPEDKLATEYLANERTFLAWIRTSIALVSLGIGLEKLSSISHEAFPNAPSTGATMHAGLGLMGLGGILAILAALHYGKTNRAIEQRQVKAEHGLVWMITATVALLALAMIYFTASAAKA